MLDPTLARLIEERLPGKRYGVFFATGEGRSLPNGDEECSGSLVTEDDEHYDYWTGWDAARDCVRFVQWQLLACEGGCDHPWETGDEYQDARRAAGLTTGAEGDERGGE